ncbi:MAG TPA: mechanosensitive ion channel domain-containing protein [Candidatus Acidoferrum sp.]|nr:mechanosensitive ion channel domain-containing protein [Candidatus Acidoferrum sp.]
MAVRAFVARLFTGPHRLAAFFPSEPKDWAPKPLYDSLNGGLRWFLSWPLFRLGNVTVTPIFMIKCVIFLAALSLFTKISKAFLAHRVLAKTKIERGHQYAIVRTFGYFVFLLGLIIGLDSTGLNLRSLLVVGGALGVGVGFGLQNVVANFVAGLVILFEQPVKLGDFIDVGGTVGEVIKIGARGTWVRTFDNEVIIVPNSEFINNRVTNWTANDRTVRFSIPVGVAYGSDLEKVRTLLVDIARRHPEVLPEPAPAAVVRTFGDSSVNFLLRVSSATAVDHPWIFQSDLMIEIAKVFNEEKIEIPFPQRDIHVRSVDVPFAVTEGLKPRPKS